MHLKKKNPYCTIYRLHDAKRPFFSSSFGSVGHVEWCFVETERAFLVSCFFFPFFLPPMNVCCYMKLAKFSVPLVLLGEEPDRRDSAAGDAIRVTDLDSFSLLCRRCRPSRYLETHSAHPSQSHHTSGLLLTPAASGPTFTQWGLFIAGHLVKLHLTLQVGVFWGFFFQTSRK